MSPRGHTLRRLGRAARSAAPRWGVGERRERNRQMGEYCRCGGLGRSDLRGRPASRSGRCPRARRQAGSGWPALAPAHVVGAHDGGRSRRSRRGRAFVANAVLGTDGPTLFELDGNIVDNSGAPNLPQDWSDFQQPPANGDGPVAKTFVTDGFSGTNDTIFKGGGSQNNDDIPSGLGTADRFDEEPTSSTRSLCLSQERNLYVYFGADRYDPTGGTTNSASGSSRVAARSREAPAAGRRQDSERVHRRARERRHLRLRGVLRRRRKLGHLDLRVAGHRPEPPLREDRRQLLQPRRHDLRHDEHRSDRRSVDLLRQSGDGGREDHDRRVLRGRHQSLRPLPGSRQGPSLRESVPRRHGQLPPGHRRSRGLRRRQFQSLFEAHRRQGHNSLW